MMLTCFAQNFDTKKIPKRGKHERVYFLMKYSVIKSLERGYSTGSSRATFCPQVIEVTWNLRFIKISDLVQQNKRM